MATRYTAPTTHVSNALRARSSVAGSSSDMFSVGSTCPLIGSGGGPDMPLSCSADVEACEWPLLALPASIIRKRAECSVQVRLSCVTSCSRTCMRRSSEKGDEGRLSS